MAAARLGYCWSLCMAWALVDAPFASPQGLHVTGYGSVEFQSQQGANSTFDAHNLNLILVGKLRNDLFAAAEVEYEHGGEEIALEFGYLAFTRIRYLNILAGKFIVPFGSFNVGHPAWINKVPGRPFGFDRVIPVTYNDVGVMVRGGVPVGFLSRITYDAWVVNGLAGDPGGDLREMRDNNVDVDGPKFFGGRLAFVGPIGMDVGASLHTGVYNKDNDLSVTLVGVDARFEYRGVELKGEFVQATQQTTAADLKKRGVYLQASYLPVGWFEPAIRFSQMDFPGSSNRDLREVSVGGSLYPSDLGALRVFYRINKERSVTEAKNNLFIVQFTVAF